VIMAENCRSGFVWKTFMSSPEAGAALKAAGFRALDERDTGAQTSSVFGAATESNSGRGK
jgi:hypothetical protein